MTDVSRLEAVKELEKDIKLLEKELEENQCCFRTEELENHLASLKKYHEILRTKQWSRPSKEEILRSF
jgi:hypothetical protein